MLTKAQEGVISAAVLFAAAYSTKGIYEAVENLLAAVEAMEEEAEGLEAEDPEPDLESGMFGRLVDEEMLRRASFAKGGT